MRPGGSGEATLSHTCPGGPGSKLVPVREQESENLGWPGGWGPGLQLRTKTDALIPLPPFWRSALLSCLNYCYYF